MMNEVVALAAELLPRLRRELDLDEQASVTRLLDYSAAIAGWPARLRKWPWRNGWLRAAASRQGCQLPLHESWAARVGVPAGPGL